MAKMDIKNYKCGSGYNGHLECMDIQIAVQPINLYRIAAARLIMLVLGIVCFEIVYAQKEDPSKIKAVDITSSFKPVLREAAKINFNATPPSADTVKPKLQYEVPDP